MKLLFIHQNFPGQYLHLAQYISSLPGNTLIAIGEDTNIKNRGTIPNMLTFGYPSPKKHNLQTHHYLKSTEDNILRGQSVVRVLLELKQKGFEPDVISLHPGWGEGTFVRDIYPKTPILAFCEYYFNAGKADLAFDPEFPRNLDFNLSVRIRNSAQNFSLLTANACISPTEWQASTYPSIFRDRINIIHDGVNTDFMTPAKNAKVVLQPLVERGESRIIEPSFNDAFPIYLPGDEPKGAPVTLTKKDKVVLYIGRNLEPYRGFHVFMRALPELQRKHPDAHIVIIGKDGTSYSPSLPEGFTYKKIYQQEMEGKLDYSRIHFLDRVPYPALRELFRVSRAHIYLTYPFVLSWSMLESMSCESLVIASRTAPVEEVITHGENGLLVDFFNRDELLAALDRALSAPKDFKNIRKNARKTVVECYNLKKCLAQQIDLLNDLSRGVYPLPD